MRKITRTGGILATLLLLAACVTINIYFPAAEAEEAAEKIVKDVLGNASKVKVVPPAEDKGARLKPNEEWLIATRVLEFFIPSAHADTPNFNVDTPQIRSLQAGMRQRHASLAPHYSSGAIGFTNNALVGVRDNSAISLRDRNQVQNLVAAENRDRNALYRAIANANGHPEWEQEVRATFARKWVEGAGTSWWYQNSSGSWQQK
jgi:uncharacterized protein YdbL (DUF1318 family)